LAIFRILALPTGNIKLETLVVGGSKPPSKAQLGRYKKILAEIRSDIDMIDHAVARLGRNLQQIRDKQLYFCGGYATFKDFCEKELGKSRVQVFRLIQAYDTITTLMEAGVSEQDLPSTERLCREIRRLEPAQQAPVWRAVLKAVKNKGRKTCQRYSGESRRTHSIAQYDRASASRVVAWLRRGSTQTEGGIGRQPFNTRIQAQVDRRTSADL
jgi:hypothetical protein